MVDCNWMTRSRSIFSLIMSLIFSSEAARSQDQAICNLSIEMVGLESDAGMLRVALFDHPEAFKANTDAPHTASAPIAEGRGELAFSALPCGTYAVKVFQDENSNGELDTNLIGYPSESFGFSNDAMGRFGPPSFEQAKFLLSSPELTIRIKMK